MLRALATLELPFDRHAQRIHLTGSAVVTGPLGVLLHRHRRLGLWLQPGGHIDAGEDPLAAAVRETWEETGVRAAPVTTRLLHVDCHDAGTHRHLDLRFHLDGGTVAPAPPPGESQDVRWFAWEEAMAVADQSLRGALARVRASVAGERR